MIRFFEEVTPRIFEVDMDSVSLVTVVRCETVRKYLYAAEAAYRRKSGCRRIGRLRRSVR